MKLFSLTLVSSVAPFANEYECGKENQPHFHHYRDQNFWGHFKIGDVKYQIAKPRQNEGAAYKSKRKNLCAEAKHAIDIFGKSDSGN